MTTPLKEYKRAPSPQQASLLRGQFDRIFKRRTGYATLDRLLKRLLGRKDEILRVRERPEIPLNTNASENDIRAFVTKRKISGGTVSEKGRQARDVMLGLARICIKLKIPFFDYLDDRSPFQDPRPTPRNPPHSRSNLASAPEITLRTRSAWSATAGRSMLSSRGPRVDAAPQRPFRRYISLDITASLRAKSPNRNSPKGGVSRRSIVGPIDRLRVH